MKIKIRRMITVLLVLSIAVALVVLPASAEKEDYWFAEKEPVTDYSYSMVIVPDTQILLRNDPDNFHKIYDWILDNKEAKNIQYVLGLGDITDYDANDEWRLAYEQITRMDGVVPYSLIIGNHDSTERFNRTFNKEPYISSYEGSYDDKIENTWRTIIIGNIPYLILTLDFLPDDEILEWANGVVEAHPNHNVIVTTHAFLHSDGTPMSEGEGWHTTIDSRPRSNDGDDIWEKFVKKHENIVMVLGGHIASDRVVVTQSLGDHDNTITQILIDHQNVDELQGSAGMICIFYFSADGKKVTVETYSTVRELYYMHENQFSFDLAVVGDGAGASAVSHAVKGQVSAETQATDTNATTPAEKEQTPEKEQVTASDKQADGDAVPENGQTQTGDGSVYATGQTQNVVASDGTAVGTQGQHKEGASSGDEDSYIWLYVVGGIVLLTAIIVPVSIRKYKKSK
ncbi:MAG: metallophosphoesterase [Oscillospiraceae bacterium]|nr:metallophosphoesterase [Oscillospiraceae bacterium]